MHRRSFVSAALGAAAGLSLARPAVASDDKFEVTRSDAEWQAMLTDRQYQVMRRDGTEPAYSSPLDKQYDPGLYHCRGCDQPLYSSEHKYDSGTGWPSFWQPIKPSAIGTKRDWKLLIPRTECHCSRCGSHLGHIFDDGPQPTGKRHCLNGVSLVFKPA
ncbi:peptide-methionine (R)-S-oxide reductase MsrB [Roseovarius gahaiensis]|uniref:peptide-methionine (R)-S-oxide reductase n=1 Tax=Roseovarius gahaiensis TaxID=2716691 RepID=A0A967B7V6_9RHOB|nr:peptide-methionine (R)-S-oxide reductase MsrB [Roseovarius gahaiensis]NHQ72900.1 peptide-methionine (R)-S-oxide reductase MsrB [Roseovarius gahaiensis]